MLNRVIAGALLVALGTVVGTWIAMSRAGTPGTAVRPDRAAFAATDGVRPVPPGQPATRAEAFLGVMLAQQAVDVAADIDGTIERVHVSVGDRVRRGDRIATLDNALIERDRAMAQATLRSLRAERVSSETTLAAARDRLDRRRLTPDLFPAEELVQGRFEQQLAEAAIEAVEARIAGSEALVGRLAALARAGTVRAPFDGVVALRHLDSGATLVRGAPIVRLIGDSVLRVRFAVPGERPGLVRVEDAVVVAVDGLGASFAGVVDTVAPEVDAASGVILAEARITVSATSHETVLAGAVVRVALAEGTRP